VHVRALMDGTEFGRKSPNDDIRQTRLRRVIDKRQMALFDKLRQKRPNGIFDKPRR
jgi:hypothetical protein